MQAITNFRVSDYDVGFLVAENVNQDFSAITSTHADATEDLIGDNPPIALDAAVPMIPDNTRSRKRLRRQSVA